MYKANKYGKIKLKIHCLLHKTSQYTEYTFTTKFRDGGETMSGTSRVSSGSAQNSSGIHQSHTKVVDMFPFQCTFQQMSRHRLELLGTTEL